MMYRGSRLVSLAVVCLVALVIASAAPIRPVVSAAHVGSADIASVSTATDQTFASCRLGVGMVGGQITNYAVGPLNIGWYADWRVQAQPPPSELEYFQTIRVKQDTSGGQYLPTYQITPPLSLASGGVGPAVQQNPGAVWIVGNEPDIATQDGTTPEKYAEIYHEVYHFIKNIDPTAQIAIAGLVQPTPLRLQYLDRVLAAYRSRYGVQMPVDVWNTHLYIAREVRGEWGVKIPVGIEGVDYGVMYSLEQQVDVEAFKDLIVDLRVWMKARGYQDRPLIITEWGGLMPLWFLSNAGVTEQDFHLFVRDAIQYMTTARDTELGFPGDDYRLVQRQAFWSLNADHVFPDGFPEFGPPLFSSTPPYAITSTGRYYRDVIAPAYEPRVDLTPLTAWAIRSATSLAPGETTSLTLKARVANFGNSAFGQDTQVEFVDVTAGGRQVLGRAILAPFTGCGTMREVSLIWSDVAPGLYTVRVIVDPDNTVSETNTGNNQKDMIVLVGTHGVFMPVVQRSFYR